MLIRLMYMYIIHVTVFECGDDVSDCVLCNQDRGAGKTEDAEGITGKETGST